MLPLKSVCYLHGLVMTGIIVQELVQKSESTYKTSIFCHSWTSTGQTFPCQHYKLSVNKTMAAILYTYQGTWKSLVDVAKQAVEPFRTSFLWGCDQAWKYKFQDVPWQSLVAADNQPWIHISAWSEDPYKHTRGGSTQIQQVLKEILNKFSMWEKTVVTISKVFTSNWKQQHETGNRRSSQRRHHGILK